MEKLYSDIMNHLSQIEEISTIAEDYGQLESGEDGYPVTFPAILISTPNASWENYGGRAQTGRVTIEVKLAIDCYNDTHYGSTTEEDAENRINLYNRIHWLLQGFRPGTASGRQRRHRDPLAQPAIPGHLARPVHQVLPLQRQAHGLGRQLELQQRGPQRRRLRGLRLGRHQGLLVLHG